MKTTLSTNDLQKRIELLNQQFLFINQLLNCHGTLILSGGGVLFPIGPNNVHYGRLKAVLSDMGCDIAAEIHNIRFSISSANNKRKTG